MSTTPICLIVSDDLLTRNKLRNMFQKFGFDTLEAAGVKRGIKCLEQKPDVVVVLDGETEDGEDLLAVIRSLPPAEARPDSRPAVICIEAAFPRGGAPANDEYVRMRLKDADEANMKSMLRMLQV